MFNSLSDEQKKIVFADLEKIVVRACPGSGKTFTVTARLANKISKWEDRYIGIAALSFTNTAWQEIEKNLPKFECGPIKRPHFLGTIDSFINNYIFLPFGHLVMGCEKRPKLVGEPHSKWSGRFYSEQWFDKSSFNINDEFIFTQKYPIPPTAKAAVVKAIKNKKMELISLGYANQHDANYFALKILKKYPEIAESLVARFPILLIDEAQDTTEIQMAIIDELVGAGLKEILIVGDPDQAIFEWNDANPDLFVKKCSEWELKQLEECRRSSQDICNFVHKLSTLSAPARSVSTEVATLGIKPDIIEYDNLLSIKNTFIKRCESEDIPIKKEDVSILCRTKGAVNEVVNVFEGAPIVTGPTFFNDSDIWEERFIWCRDICEGLYLISKGEFKNGYRILERGCFKILNENHYSKENLRLHIKNIGLVNWRKFINDIIVSAPDISGDLSAYLSSFSPMAESFFNEMNILTAVKNNKKSLLIKDIFGISDADSKFSHLPIRLGTIHSVKGETFDATLLILKNRIMNTKYQTILSRCKKDKLLEEELRTLYVAMTRPRKILIIGVPQGDGNMWNAFLN